MAWGQIDDSANFTESPMDPEERSDVSDRSKVWTAEDGGLRAGGRKDK